MSKDNLFKNKNKNKTDLKKNQNLSLLNYCWQIILVHSKN